MGASNDCCACRPGSIPTPRRRAIATDYCRSRCPRRVRAKCASVRRTKLLRMLTHERGDRDQREEHIRHGIAKKERAGVVGPKLAALGACTSDASDQKPQQA